VTEIGRVRRGRGAGDTSGPAQEQCGSAGCGAAQAGPKTAAGQEVRPKPTKARKKIFIFVIPNTAPNQILNKQTTFSQDGPKIKVDQDFVLYNFVKRHKAKIPTNFELGLKS
jgi:hypothetical protein